MSFGNDTKTQSLPQIKYGAFSNCQGATDTLGKSSHAQLVQAENDENSSELANTGFQGNNNNLGGSHIFG
jgi:hypothetical protein